MRRRGAQGAPGSRRTGAGAGAARAASFRGVALAVAEVSPHSQPRLNTRSGTNPGGAASAIHRHGGCAGPAMCCGTKPPCRPRGKGLFPNTQGKDWEHRFKGAFVRGSRDGAGGTAPREGLRASRSLHPPSSPARSAHGTRGAGDTSAGPGSLLPSQRAQIHPQGLARLRAPPGHHAAPAEVRGEFKNNAGSFENWS